MIVDNRTRHREWAPGKRTGIQSRNLLLLFIEVAAVIGLLFAAYELWQTHQTLQRDLHTAQEIQAIIQDEARQTGGAAHDLDQDSARPVNEWQPFDSTAGQPSQAQPFFWGAAPEIGAGNG